MVLETFQLAAQVQGEETFHLCCVPMAANLQALLATEWTAQLDAFTKDVKEIAFDPGYRPDTEECFTLADFKRPDWLPPRAEVDAGEVDKLGQDAGTLGAVRAMLGFGYRDGEACIVWQRFNRANVIEPKRALFFGKNLYKPVEQPILRLNDALDAVYWPKSRKLLFRSFHIANTFLPLAEFYAEASDQEIREVLDHATFAAEDAKETVRLSSQWARKRFAMLRRSGILDHYSVKEIRERSKEYELDLTVKGGKIVFPKAKAEARKLLQFLNEELFRGAITSRLYETNSKREAG